MNDRQLRSFILAAKVKSFSRAAALSFISTPALINQINLLEKDTDLVLFDRDTHGIMLTADGERFYRTATQIINLYDNCLTECHINQNKGQKLLRICGINLGASDQFVAYANQYSRQNPNIRVYYYDVPMDKKIAAIIADEIDIAAVAEPMDCFKQEFVYTPLISNCYSVIVAADHPLAARSRVTMEDLKGYHCICDKQNYRKENPKETFAMSGAYISYTENEIDDHMIMNAIMHGDVVLRYSIWSNHLDSPQLKVVDTDIEVGTLGLLRKKAAPAHIEKFIAGYLEYYNEETY